MICALTGVFDINQRAAQNERWALPDVVVHEMLDLFSANRARALHRISIYEPRSADDDQCSTDRQ